MNSSKTYFLFIVIYFSLFLGERLGNHCISQNKNIDTLLIQLKNDKRDTNRVKHFNRLCLEYTNISQYDTAFYYGNQAMLLSEDLNFQKGIATSNNLIGTIYTNQGNYSKALGCYQKSKKIN